MTSRRIRYLAPLVVLALAAVVAAFLISSGNQSSAPSGPSQPLVLAPPQSTVVPLLTATAGASYPLRLHRDDGAEVVLPAQPRRILSLSAGATEILFEIGAGPQVVAVSSDADYPPDTAGLPHIAANAGAGVIQALQADVIIVVGAAPQTVAMLDAVGVPVVALNQPGTVAELEQQIQFFGDITGRLAAAQRAAATLERRVEAIQRQLGSVQQGPTVFVEVGAGQAAG
ncbi:MAG TPA: ABC transporter substrate-binding protein, partial [Dehalococcoidia bacterium]